MRISPGSAACSRRAADVDRVAGDEVWGRRVTGDDLPGVHAVRMAMRDAHRILELIVQPSGPPHLGRRAHGPKGVVLVDAGMPNTAMIASPMNFSTVPVPLEDRLIALEVPRHDPAEGLGIEPFAKVSRARRRRRTGR